MRRSTGNSALICALALTCVAGAARADSYAADKAYAAQDFARAFALYEELAQLGNLRAQENLALMYVSGEGVKRDNVMGYAWAIIARENGSSDAVQPIIDQLGPHMTDAARQRVAVVQQQFGKAALERSLLPLRRLSAANAAPGCTFKIPANPDNYYPPDAARRGYSGNVYIEFEVGGDGRARNPRVRYAWPPKAFDEPARAVVFASTFKPKIENGHPVNCSMFIAVKFTLRGGSNAAGDEEMQKAVADARVKAQAGDPQSQFQLGLALLARPDLTRQNEFPLDILLKSAQSGVPSAQYLVGRMLLSGSYAEPDPSKGRRWIDFAAKSGQADALVEQAYQLLVTRTDAAEIGKAMDLLEQAAITEQREAKLYLASLLAAGPVAERRNGERAIQLIDVVMPEAASDPTAHEIRAAANATSGDFLKARADQKRAIALAKRIGRAVEPLEERLAQYEKSAAWTGWLIDFF